MAIFLVVLRRSKVIPPGDDDLYSGFGKEDVAPALATHDLEYDPAFQVGNFPSRSERFQWKVKVVVKTPRIHICVLLQLYSLYQDMTPMIWD